MSALLPTMLAQAILPALALLPPAMTSPGALVLLQAIGLQESDFIHRWQIVDVHHPQMKGPARSFWGFELGDPHRGGGVWGVVLHPSSRFWLAQVCKARGLEFHAFDIWTAIEQDDVLAAALARLLIFTDAAKLPAPEDARAGWELYAKRCWRPGKPRPADWPDNHARALACVREMDL